MIWHFSSLKTLLNYTRSFMIDALNFELHYKLRSLFTNCFALFKYIAKCTNYLKVFSLGQFLHQALTFHKTTILDSKSPYNHLHLGSLISKITGISCLPIRSQLLPHLLIAAQDFKILRNINMSESLHLLKSFQKLFPPLSSRHF